MPFQGVLPRLSSTDNQRDGKLDQSFVVFQSTSLESSWLYLTLHSQFLMKLASCVAYAGESPDILMKSPF